MTAGRAKALALKEAYRLIPVREGEKILTMPAIQVVLRNQVALAAKGSGPAQRAIIEGVQAIEREHTHDGSLPSGRDCKTCSIGTGKHQPIDVELWNASAAEGHRT